MIYLVTHYYPPESNPPANRMGLLARELLAAYGPDRLTVVTGRPNHPEGILRPGFRWRLFKRGRGPAGETVHHLYALAAPNLGFFRKTLGFATFGLSVFLYFLFRRLGEGDVVYITNPPSFAGYAASALVRLKKRFRFVFDVRDLMPQIVADMGFLREESLAYRLLLRLSHDAYRKALHVVANAPGMCEYIRPFAGEDGVSLVYNPVDLELFRPLSPAERQAFRRSRAAVLGPEGETVFFFAGSHAPYMDLPNLVEAFSRLPADPPSRLVLAGFGEVTGDLKKQAAALGLADRVIFPGYLERRELVRFLSAADFLLSTRGPHVNHRIVVPTKIIEYMALGKFTLCAHGSTFVRELEERGLCRDVPPGDPGALAALLEKALRGEVPREVAADGWVAERFSDQAFSRRMLGLFAQWVKD